MKTFLRRLAAGLLFALPLASAMAGANMEVWRDPNCGCCGQWVQYVEAQGIPVTVHVSTAMDAVKARLRVPAAAMSCHTAIIDGYAIEGHVPVEDIRRLLAERPDAIGLAAPGMPMGSPGMEGPRADRYQVLLIHRDGTLAVWATHGPAA